MFISYCFAFLSTRQFFNKKNEYICTKCNGIDWEIIKSQNFDILFRTGTSKEFQLLAANAMFVNPRHKKYSTAIVSHCQYKRRKYFNRLWSRLQTADVN